MEISRRHLGLVALVLLICGLGFMGYGLCWAKGPLKQDIWDPAGWRRFKMFAMIVVPGALALLLVCRGRWALGCTLAVAAGLTTLMGLAPVAAVLYLFLSCMCLGHLAVGRHWEGDWEPLTETVLNALVGFALLSLFLNVAMHFRINTQTMYILLLAVPLVLARNHLGTWWSAGKEWLLGWHPQRLTVVLLGSLILFILAVDLALVALPERGWDALVMHLRIGAVVNTDRCWSFDATDYYPAVYPMNADLFFAVGYLLAGESGARLVNFLFFLMVLWLLYSEVARHCGTVLGLVFAGLFASAPMVFVVNSCLLVENVLAAFFLGSFLVLARRFNRLRLQDALALAAMLGSAASTKLHGAVFAALVVPVAVILGIRHLGLRQALKILALASTVAILLAIPPYLTAYRATGNPIFPWYNAVFKSPLFPTASNFLDHRWKPPTWKILWDLTFHTQRHLDAFDGAFGFHFLVLGLAGVVVSFLSRNRMAILAALLAAGYVVGTSHDLLYARYLHPVFPIFLLACTGFCALRKGGLPWVGRLAVVVGVGLIVLNLYFFPTGSYDLRFFYVQGLFSEEKRDLLINPQRRITRVVNALAGPKAKVLFCCIPFASDLQGKPYFACDLSQRFCSRFMSVPDPEGLFQVLRKEGITHAIVEPDYPMLNRHVLEEVLAKHSKKVTQVAGASLYEFALP